jgi:hypothetical protein
MFHEFVKREGHGNVVELMKRRYCGAIIIISSSSSNNSGGGGGGGGARKKKKRNDKCTAKNLAAIEEDGTRVVRREVLEEEVIKLEHDCREMRMN